MGVSIYDGILYVVWAVSMVFIFGISSPQDSFVLGVVVILLLLKKYRKATLETYLAFNLILLSYALYEGLWLMLALILLLKRKCMMDRREKKLVRNLYKFRESKLFKLIVVIFILISFKNYIFYGTNAFRGITKPIKLSLEKIKFEWAIEEPVWVVPISEYSSSNFTFRTKEFFPVSGPLGFYYKSIENQFLIYEKDMLNELFPYDKFISFKNIDYSGEGEYKNRPTYEEWIGMDKEKSKREDISFTIRVVLKKNIGDESDLAEFEEGMFKLFEYYEDKKIVFEEVSLVIYSETNDVVNLEKKVFSGKSWEGFKFYNFYEKWRNEVKRWDTRIIINREIFNQSSNSDKFKEYWRF